LGSHIIVLCPHIIVLAPYYCFGHHIIGLGPILLFWVPYYCFGPHIISFLLRSSINSMTLSLSPLHFTVTKTLQKSHSTLQHRSIRNGIEGKGADGGDASRCTSKPAQAVTLPSL
jgi:hypothetical protein